MESIREAFGYPRTSAGIVTPDAKQTWSAEMIRAAKTDARDFIDEAPVSFIAIEKMKRDIAHVCLCSLWYASTVLRIRACTAYCKTMGVSMHVLWAVSKTIQTP